MICGIDETVNVLLRVSMSRTCGKVFASASSFRIGLHYFFLSRETLDQLYHTFPVGIAVKLSHRLGIQFVGVVTTGITHTDIGLSIAVEVRQRHTVPQQGSGQCRRQATALPDF